MDISSLIGGIIGGALGGSALAKFIIDAAKDRWMESVKAQSAAELEILKSENNAQLEGLKDSFESAQKALQSRLDHGTYVTRAQYDLELSAYGKLWPALSNLRESWRSFFYSYAQLAENPENADVRKTFEDTLKTAFTANDEAVLISGQLAPFYEKNILLAARATTLESNGLVFMLKQLSKGQVPLAEGEAEARLNAIILGTEQIDDLIRQRLASLRLI